MLSFPFLTLAISAAAAAAIAGLASKARDAAKKAERRHRSLEQICQCSERLLALPPDTDIIRSILKTYRNIFDLKAVCFFDGETAETHAEGDADRLCARTRAAYITGLDSDDADRRISIRCIRTRGRPKAAIGFEMLRDPELTARSLLTMTAVTLDRAQAFHAAGIAAAETRTEVFRATVLDALAHELKTPLASILAAAGGLHELATNTTQRELAGEIEGEACRLTELTSSLLRKADLECEQVQAHMSTVDLAFLMESLIETYTRRHEGRRISFDRTSDVPVPVTADRELLGLAVSHLLDNAVKYSPQEALVAVSLTTEGEAVLLRVWNAGSFIAQRDRRRIFDRFYRGANVGRQPPGTGLGLYLARKIVTAHHGSLMLEASDATEGVAFCITLPSLGKDIKDAETTDELVGSR